MSDFVEAIKVVPAKVNKNFFSADGSIYYGEINENGEPHGYGLIVSETGDFYYEGEWANGLFNGKGGFVFFGVLEYYGDFLNENMHGYGILKNPLYTYEGHF